MRIKYFAQEYAWFIVGVPVIFSIGSLAYEKLVPQPSKKEKVEALSNSTKASTAQVVKVNEKLQLLKEAGAKHRACVANPRSSPNDCNELAAKLRQAQFEYRQAFDDMDKQLSESNQKFCELMPASETCDTK